jgi:hypothetical protein
VYHTFGGGKGHAAHAKWLCCYAAAPAYRGLVSCQQHPVSPAAAAFHALCLTPWYLLPHVGPCRADSIVRDAELVRKSLVPKDNYDGRWSVLGQSFGGFCVVTYLSIAPEGRFQHRSYTGSTTVILLST